MSFKLKSKRKIVEKNVGTESGVEITKITKSSKILDLENRAVKELENLAKRQSETGIYKSPSITVNKRSFAKSLVSVEKHNLKIKKCDVKNADSRETDSKKINSNSIRIVGSKKKFSALSYAESEDFEDKKPRPVQNDKSHANKIDLTE